MLVIQVGIFLIFAVQLLMLFTCMEISKSSKRQQKLAETMMDVLTGSEQEQPNSNPYEFDLMD